MPKHFVTRLERAQSDPVEARRARWQELRGDGPGEFLEPCGGLPAAADDQTAVLVPPEALATFQAAPEPEGEELWR